MNVVYNMDCLEAMRKMPDNAFDLAVVDPPYGDAGGGGEQIRRIVRPLQVFRGGVARQEEVSRRDTTPSGSEKARAITRTGGTWAAKYAKKSSRGTSPRKRNTSTNFSASHGTRLSGGATTSTFLQRGASSFFERQIFRKKVFQWLRSNMPGRRSTGTQKS